MLKRGKYQTKGGREAIVAQLKCHGGAQWIFSGAIVDPNGLLHPHHWNIDGTSNSGQTIFGLVMPSVVEEGAVVDVRADIIPFPIRTPQPQVMVG